MAPLLRQAPRILPRTLLFLVVIAFCSAVKVRFVTTMQAGVVSSGI